MDKSRNAKALEHMEQAQSALAKYSILIDEAINQLESSYAQFLMSSSTSINKNGPTYQEIFKRLNQRYEELKTLTHSIKENLRTEPLSKMVATATNKTTN